MANEIRRYFKNLLITSSSPLLTAQLDYEHKGKDKTAAASKGTDADTVGRSAVFQTDVVLEEIYDLRNEITLDVVQSNVDEVSVNDSAYAKRMPLTLTIEGAIGSDDNALIGSAFRNAQRLGPQITEAKDFVTGTASNDIAESGSYPAIAFRNLSVFANRLVLCRVTAGFATYRNMLITNLNVRRDRTNTNSLIFKITLQQLRSQTIEKDLQPLAIKQSDLETGWEFLGPRVESNGRVMMEDLDPAASTSILSRVVADFNPFSKSASPANEGG